MRYSSSNLNRENNGQKKKFYKRINRKQINSQIYVNISHESNTKSILHSWHICEYELMMAIDNKQKETEIHLIIRNMILPPSAHN